ncbi:MAG TPA: hypothetical protein G4O08_10805 [Anaerolineae bacterium]|nr:hypothetical protein [Anaerolineae bacterium]
MKRLQAVDLGILMWKQVRFGADHFQLLAGEDCVGELYWTKWFSDLAVAQCAHGTWHMDRPDFFADRVIVTDPATEQRVAIFVKGCFGDGPLTMRDGREYEWARTKTFRNYWALFNEGGEVIFEIRAGMRWFKHEADVVLHAAASKEPDLPLLLLLGWYLVFMAIQDSAAVGAVVATTAAAS